MLRNFPGVCDENLRLRSSQIVLAQSTDLLEKLGALAVIEVLAGQLFRVGKQARSDVGGESLQNRFVGGPFRFKGSGCLRIRSCSLRIGPTTTTGHCFGATYFFAARATSSLVSFDVLEASVWK